MTIVELKKNQKRYVLLGTGFGAFKATRPSYWLGSLNPVNEEGTYHMVAITDESGTIFWCHSKDLKVVEIDGVKIEDLNLG